MTTGTDTTLAAARRYVETYNNRTDEFVDACTTEDFTALHYPGGEVLAEGREALRAAAHGVLRALPDRQVVVREMTSEGDWAVAQVTYTGTVAEAMEGFPPPGESFAIDFLMVWQIRDGRVAIEHIYRS